MVFLYLLLNQIQPKQEFFLDKKPLTKRLDNLSGNIPKIIHQTAPKNSKLWPDTWKICQQTWKKHFPYPEYKYILWTDDDLNNFIKTHYQWFYPYFVGYKHNICRIDAARYFILYHYGGIYADMDFYCFQNFYNQLDSNKISIVESPYKYNESLQNSLMASPKKHDDWKIVFKYLIKNRKKIKVLDISGPRLLDEAFENRNINVLVDKLYNPDMKSVYWESHKLYTKHYLTNVWTQKGYGPNIRDKMFT